MIRLSHILEQIGNGTFYDWTREFDTFKTTLDSATESAKSRFEKSLSGKIVNKSVLVRASKGYKQPVKDYTLKRVTGVNINDFYNDWVVVIKNEFNKEYFLTAGYKIKVLGSHVAQEPGAAEAPTQQEPISSPVQNEPEKPVTPPAPQGIPSGQQRAQKPIKK